MLTADVKTGVGKIQLRVTDKNLVMVEVGGKLLYSDLLLEMDTIKLLGRVHIN